METTGPLAEGSTFRGLERVTFLRRDGNGFLYRARHATLARTSLLRVLPVGPSPDTSLVEGFLERARRLSAFDHPHVARVHDFGREGDLLYLSMEGGEDTASEHEGQHSGTTEHRLPLQVLKGVSLGLAALHAEGIAHGGVALGAFHRDADGSVRLSDFSLVPKSVREEDPLTSDLSALEEMLPTQIALEHALEVRRGAAAAVAAIERLHQRRRHTRLALRGTLIGLTLSAAVLAVLLLGLRTGPRENIIGRIDLERDVVHGSWECEGTALWCRSADKVSRIQIPVSVPEEYDLVLEGLHVYPPPAGWPPGEVAIGLLFGGRQASVCLDARPSDGFRSGLELIDEREAYDNETTRAGRVLSTDHPHSVVCSVRRGALRVRVDGQAIIDWRGDFRRLSLHPVRWVPRKDALIFLVSRTRCRLEAMYLVPYKPGTASQGL